MRRAALLLSLAALAAPFAAHAHRGNSQKAYVSTVAAVIPNVLGVSANVLGGDDRLRLSNYSGKTILVLGYEREPYLRFDKLGVYVNTRSPAAYLNRFRYPPALAPGSADPKAVPRWRRVAGGVTYEWHDHRIHWTGRQAPPAVRRSPDQLHRIFNWRVPARANGKPFAITGFLGYVPRPGASADGGNGWVEPAAYAGIGVSAAAALVIGVGARRRKRRAP